MKLELKKVGILRDNEDDDEKKLMRVRWWRI